VRRAYINVTGNVTDKVSFRITPDVTTRQTTTTSGLPAGATVSNSLDSSLTIRLKYGYGQFNLDKPLRTKDAYVRFGQQPTPYINFMEAIYRYRFQGTTFTEREGYQSSADVGIAGHYNFPGDYGDVYLGYYNGDTYSKAEVNDQKSFQIRASVRPIPKKETLKGLRLHFFFNADHPVKDAERQRFVFTTTFENPKVNLGFDYIDAKDSASAHLPVVEGKGWSVWVTPRTRFGLEGIFRHDDLKPNTAIDGHKTRTLVGIAYWLHEKGPLAVAVMPDYEQVKYDPALAKPKEERYELKVMVSF
jgi:hypothetical protein